MTNWGGQWDRRRRTCAPHRRSIFRPFIIASAFAAPLASADYQYWIGGSGDWGVPLNWSRTPGGPPGAFPPGANDNPVYIRTNDSLDRTINLSLGVNGPIIGDLIVTNDVYVDSQGTGPLTLQLATGRFGASNVYLGTTGTARVVQTGGSADIGGLFLSRFGAGEAAASSTYQLSAG